MTPDPKMVEAGKKAWETRRQKMLGQQPNLRTVETQSNPTPIIVPYDDDLQIEFDGQELPWVEKYRPVSLNDVIGDVVGYLKSFVKTGSMPLAFVFFGDFGTGKTTAAKAFTRDYFVFRGIFTREATFADIKNGRNFTADYEGCWPPVLYVDLATQIANDTTDIDMVRSLILRFMQTRGLLNLPKFSIFDEADRLSVQAQGALRSLLEKYPNTRTIYTTNRVESIDRAILSRAAGGVFEFKKPTANELVAYMNRILVKEQRKLPDTKLEEIAIAVSSVREAVGRLQQEMAVLKAKGRHQE